MFLHERWWFLIFASLAHITNRMSNDQTATYVARLSGDAEACKNGSDSSCLSLDSSKFNSLFVAHDWAACLGAAFTGFFIRKFGIWIVSLASSVVLFVGGLVFAIGPYLDSTNDAAFAALVSGRAIFGFAMFSELVLSLQVMSHWFFKKELALAFGVYFTFGKIGTIIATMTGGILVENYGLQLTLWINFLIGFVGPAGTIAAGYIYKTFAARQLEVNIVYDNSGENSFHFSKLAQLSLDFWVLCLLCLFYYCVFYTTMADFPKYAIEVFNYPESLAGQVSSLIPILTLFAPVFGYLIDRFGHRDTMTFLATGILFFTVLFQTFIRSIPPAVTASFVGITCAVCSTSIWSSISVMEHPRVVGVAHGIATGGQQFGIGALLLVTGFMLNAMGEGRWRNFFALQTGIAGLAWILSVLSSYLDWKHHGSKMRKPEYSHHDSEDEPKEKSPLIAKDDDSITRTPLAE